MNKVKHLYFISGASRGIGAAMLAALDQPTHHIVSYSRRAPNPTHAASSTWQEADLSKLNDIENISLTIKTLAKTHQNLPITLIHNAAQVHPMAQVGNWQHVGGNLAKLDEIVRLNTLAPFYLSDALLSTPNPNTAPRNLLFISSGAAYNAYPGWSIYCATKAAISHFASTIAEETRNSPHIRVVSLSPGVIDTDMQADIRQSSPEYFPNHARFIQLHEQHALSTPTNTANAIITLLNHPNFGEKTLVDLRNFQ